MTQNASIRSWTILPQHDERNGCYWKEKEDIVFDLTKKPSLKGKNIEDYKRIIDTLYDELKRRDTRIDELKDENNVLVKTVIRAENRVKDLEEKLSKIK